MRSLALSQLAPQAENMQKTRLSLAFDGLSPAFLASIFLPKPVFGHELMVYVDLKARSINLYYLSKRSSPSVLVLGLLRRVRWVFFHSYTTPGAPDLLSASLPSWKRLKGEIELATSESRHDLTSR